jgi:glycosyltransferase involved in cell wall biosynthesis
MINMKILYHSVSPLTMSGYGRCTAELVYRLLEWFDVDIAAYHGIQNADITVTLDGKHGPKEVRIIGGDGTVWHPLLPEIAHKYTIIIDHHDLWFVWQQLQQLRGSRWVWWAIVDHEPLPEPVRQCLKSPNMVKAVPMTNWAKEVMLRACEADNIDPEVVADPIPHGIDTDEWKPVKDAKISGVPDDAEFVVCSVVANHGPRENIPTMIEAFAIFLKETKANAYYYIHADPISSTGYNLPLVVKACEELYGVELKDRILFKGSRGRYTDEYLRNIYSRSDVHLLAIMGGSFEIPILEAACCGTPSIVTNFSAPAEVVGYGERGLLVEPVGWLWMQLASARQAVVNPYDVAEALRIYYEDPDLRKRHVKKMMEWIEKNATWDIVARKWKKLLDEIYDEILNYGRAYYIGRHVDVTEWQYFDVHGDVLELGCGCGELLEHLKQKGCNVTGVEVSDYAVKVCRQKGLNVVKADAQNLPFHDGSFDFVVSQHLLEHTNDVIKTIKESVRVARKKAIHIIPGHEISDPTHKVNHFTEEMVNDICMRLTEEGYKVYAYPEGRDRDWVLEVAR